MKCSISPEHYMIMNAPCFHFVTRVMCALIPKRNVQSTQVQRKLLPQAQSIQMSKVILLIILEGKTPKQQHAKVVYPPPPPFRNKKIIVENITRPLLLLKFKYLSYINIWKSMHLRHTKAIRRYSVKHKIWKRQNQTKQNHQDWEKQQNHQDWKNKVVTTTSTVQTCVCCLSSRWR